MTSQEQINRLSERLVACLCRNTERPSGWLPHIVFVEEEGADGHPCYVRYELEDYHSDGSCTLFNPQTGVRETDRHLGEINVDWLVTLWNRYEELCLEQHLIFVADSLPPFRNGDFVRLTDEAVAEVRKAFGDAPADYRRNMLLQVKHVRQDEADGSWHVGVQDIHEDDVQEFAAGNLRTATAEDLLALSGKGQLYAFVWDCNFFGRNETDEKIIEIWKKGPARSLNDAEDDTEYEVERLTPDELAERINDEMFNDLESYVRFIRMPE